MHVSSDIYQAVYEHGVFRLLTPFEVSIPEGQRVQIKVEALDTPEEILKIATQVYEGFSDPEIEELEQIILDRNSFLGKGIFHETFHLKGQFDHLPIRELVYK